jgi:hypothetical protein
MGVHTERINRVAEATRVLSLDDAADLEDEDVRREGKDGCLSRDVVGETDPEEDPKVQAFLVQQAIRDLMEEV